MTNDISDGPFVAVRVFPTGFTIGQVDGTDDQREEWGVDLVDANGGYSEEVWDHYGDLRLDRATAIRIAPEMASEYGCAGLPVRVLES